MKSIFLAFFLLASVAVHAAAPTCTVTNTSSCTVFYRIVLSVVNGTPTCTQGAVSSLIALPPGGTVTYNAGTVPGVAPAARYFMGAIVYDAPPACGPTGVQLGDVCTPYPLSTTLNMQTAGCTNCQVLTATWTPSVALGAPCSLSF